MEEKAVYMLAVDPDMVVNDTCTVYIRHKGMISYLIARGIVKNRSEAYRKGIEMLYAAHSETETGEAG